MSDVVDDAEWKLHDLLVDDTQEFEESVRYTPVKRLRVRLFVREHQVYSRVWKSFIDSCVRLRKSYNFCLIKYLSLRL